MRKHLLCKQHFEVEIIVLLLTF